MKFMDQFLHAVIYNLTIYNWMLRWNLSNEEFEQLFVLLQHLQDNFILAAGIDRRLWKRKTMTGKFCQKIFNYLLQCDNDTNRLMDALWSISYIPKTLALDGWCYKIKSLFFQKVCDSNLQSHGCKEITRPNLNNDRCSWKKCSINVCITSW